MVVETDLPMQSGGKDRFVWRVLVGKTVPTRSRFHMIATEHNATVVSLVL